MANPFGESVVVDIDSDSSGFQDGINAAQDSMDGFEQSVDRMAQGLAAGAGAALAGSTNAAMDFESSLADIEKVTDAATADELGDDIKDLAGEIPLAHSELAELSTQAGRMGAEGADEIAAFTETAAQMGAATTLNADEAGMALGKMASSLNEELGDVDQLGDSINELSNNFQTTSDEIVDSSQRSGQALTTLGMESDEILGVSAAMNELSPTSRIAATRMEAFGETLMDPSNIEFFADATGRTSDEFETLVDESPEQAMTEMMNAVDDGTVSFEDLEEHMTTAQARAWRDTADGADEFAEAMDMSNDAMEEGGSLANELGVETDTASGQLTLMRNNLRTLGIEIGDVILPYVRDFIDVTNDLLVSFTEWIRDGNEVTAVLGLLGTLIGGLLPTITGLIGAVGGGVGSFAALRTIILRLLGPIGLAISAALLLGQAWESNLGGIQEHAERVWESVSEAISMAMEIIEEVVDVTLGNLTEIFTSNGDEIDSIANDVFGGIADFIESTLEFIGELWDQHGEQVLETIDAFTQSIADAVNWLLDEQVRPFLETLEELWEVHFDDTMENASGAVDALAEAVTVAVDLMVAAWNLFGDEVIAVLQFTFDFLRVIVENSLDAILTTINVVLALIQGDWDEAWTQITEFADRALGRIIDLAADWGPRFLDWLAGFAASAIEAFVDFGQTLVTDTFPSMFADILGFAVDWGPEFVGWVVDFGADAVDAFVDFAADALDVFLDWGPDALDVIVDFSADALDTISNWATDVLSRVGELVSEFVSEITSLGSDVTGEIASMTSDALSTVTDWTGDVLSVVSDLASDVVSEISSLASDAVSEIDGMASDAYSALSEMASDIISAVSDMASDVVSEVQSMMSDFVSAITGAVSDVTSAISDIVSNITSPLENIDLYSIGTGMIDSLISGVQDKIPDVGGAVEGVADTVSSVLPGSDADEGPLSNFTDQTDAIPETLASAMEAGERLVGKAATSMLSGQLDPTELTGRSSTSSGDSSDGDQYFDIDIHADGDDTAEQVEDGMSSAFRSFGMDG